MKRTAHPFCSIALRRFLLPGILGLASLWEASGESSGPTAPGKSAELFQWTNLWTVHLKFTAEQWKAMEPEGGARR